jgi:hypothetical protein
MRPGLIRLAGAWALLAALGLSAAGDAASRRSLQLPVKGTALTVEMLPMKGADGRVTLWLGRTEVPWELLDAFVYGRDEKAGPAEADAVARPTKPYISVDRGFGHAGFPALSINVETARRLCDWMSAKTGRKFRLPTVKELQSLCGDALPGQPPLDQRAWHAGNAAGVTHRVASAKPDANGFSDLLGNVAEWATDADGKAVLWGGSYVDAAKDLTCTRVQPPVEEWNDSDPQVPPSKWWLADAAFAGMRLACEPMPSDNPPVEKPAQDTHSSKESKP